VLPGLLTPGRLGLVIGFLRCLVVFADYLPAEIYEDLVDICYSGEQSLFDAGTTGMLEDSCEWDSPRRLADVS